MRPLSAEQFFQHVLLVFVMVNFLLFMGQTAREFFQLFDRSRIALRLQFFQCIVTFTDDQIQYPFCQAIQSDSLILNGSDFRRQKTKVKFFDDVLVCSFATSNAYPVEFLPIGGYFREFAGVEFDKFFATEKKIFATHEFRVSPNASVNLKSCQNRPIDGNFISTLAAKNFDDARRLML